MVKYLFVIFYLCVVMFLNLFFYVCFDNLFYNPLLQFTLVAQRLLSGCLQFIYRSLSFFHTLNSP